MASTRFILILTHMSSIQLNCWLGKVPEKEVSALGSASSI